MKKVMSFLIHPRKIGETGSWFDYSIQIGHSWFNGHIEEGFSNFPQLIIFLEDIIEGKSAVYQTFSPNSEIEVCYSKLTDLVGEVEIRRGFYEYSNKVYLAGRVYKIQLIQEIYLNLILLSNNKNVIKYQNTEYRYYDWEITNSAKVESFLTGTFNKPLL